MINTGAKATQAPRVPLIIRAAKPNKNSIPTTTLILTITLLSRKQIKIKD